MENTVLNVREYGAVGDGCTKCTEILQQCIDICNEEGGGTVVLERGTYVCGALYLKSNVALEIRESAILLASPDIGDYAADTHYNRYKNEHDMDRCWIYAEGQSNFTIRGNGEINGNAKAFPNNGSIYRPMMMRFLRCENIHLRDVRLMDAASWTTAFLDSSYIWVDNVRIKNETNYNGDGLDFDGCSHVFVCGCSITGTDDNLCLQAGSREYPVDQIHITNCEFTSLCAGIRIGLKSVGTIHNVVISGCTMKNVWREGIKIECTEGGDISGICIENIVMHNVSRPVFVILNNQFNPDGLGNSIALENVPRVGRMDKIIIQNLLAEDDEEMAHAHLRFNNDLMGAPWFNGIRFDAAKGYQITDVTMENVRYKTIGGIRRVQIPDSYPEIYEQKSLDSIPVAGNYYPDWSRAAFMDLRNVKHLYLSNVGFQTVYDDERQGYILENCEVLKEEVFLN